MKWKVPYIDFGRQFKKQEKLHLNKFKDIMNKGDFVLRGEVEKFEKTVAKYLGVKYVVSVNSCTDAILLTLGSLGFNKSTAFVAFDFRKFNEFFAPTMLANFNKLLIFNGPVIPT